MFKIYNVLRELNVSVKYQQAAGQGSNCFLVCVRIMKTCPVLHLYTRWINLCDIWCNWTWIVYCSLKSKVPPLRFHRPASNAAQPLNVANKATHFHCLGRCLIIHSIIPPYSLLTSTSQARPEWCLKGNLWAGYHKTSSVLSRTFLQFLLFSPHFSAPAPTADSAGPNHTINYSAASPRRSTLQATVQGSLLFSKFEFSIKPDFRIWVFHSVALCSFS